MSYHDRDALVPAHLRGVGIVDGGDYEREPDPWFLPEQVEARKAAAKRLAQLQEEIRQSFIDRFEGVPLYIDPFGKPVFREDETSKDETATTGETT